MLGFRPGARHSHGLSDGAFAHQHTPELRAPLRQNGRGSRVSWIPEHRVHSHSHLHDHSHGHDDPHGHDHLHSHVPAHADSDGHTDHILGDQSEATTEMSTSRSHQHISFFGWQLTLVDANAESPTHHGVRGEPGQNRLPISDLVMRWLRIRSPMPPAESRVLEREGTDFRYEFFRIDNGRERDQPTTPPPDAVDR